jgi:NADH-quinone oxidoreductase subunit L
MSELRHYLWLIPVLPLLAAAFTAFLGPGLLRKHRHWPCILALVGSCLLSILVLVAVRQGIAAADHDAGAVQEIAQYYEWLSTRYVHVAFGLRADPLSAVMLVTVTFVGSFIAIYAVGYMHGDPGYPRFFAEVALFIFSMTLLVLADNFVLLYAGWEGVGLCSYLLIGFWFAKPAAAAAARKAFLVTRLGDVGLLLGILLLWYGSGFRVDYDGVFEHANGTLVPTACLLLFCGAVGKSAQFPLHVWLPDAMEGPTPVSALIHAATMVTAGVYLVARCTPLFVQAPDAQMVVAGIGGFTALLAALIALTQNDLKRVLAYSTISQLGYMFLALGSATAATTSRDLVTLAVVAAIFHLFTHAFFKALLFLSAGSVMHAMGGVIDMRRLGGLRRLMPRTHLTFLCGALALAGVPLFSGFWSKDEILGATLSASGAGHPHRVVYAVLLVVGLVTAGLTAFYTFRGYFLTFWGEERIPPEAGHHAHESPPVMTIPLIVLAVGAVAAGLIVGPNELLGHFLSHTRGLSAEAEPHMHVGLMAGSSLIALAGVAVAWWMYLRQPGLAGRLAQRFPALYQLSLNKFHVDELYASFVVQPLLGLMEFCRVLDQYVVDGLVDLVGRIPRLVGDLFRPVQNGLVQFYALATLLAVVVILLALVIPNAVLVTGFVVAVAASVVAFVVALARSR